MLKYLIQLLASLFLIIALIVIGLVIFYDPNHFKDLVSREVTLVTGQPFDINGDIQLQVWPRLSLSLTDATLGEKGQGLYTKIQKANISLRNRQIALDATFETILFPQNIHWYFELESLGNQFHVVANDQKGKKIQDVTGYFQQITKDEHEKLTIENITIEKLQFSIIYLNAFRDLIKHLPYHVVINHFNIQNLYFLDIPFHAISAHVDIHKNLMQVSSLDAILYEGKLTGDILLNFRNEIPEAEIDVKIKKANLGSLLTYIEKDNQITGEIAFNLQVDSKGIDTVKMQKNAFGHAKVEVANCVYHGNNYGQAVRDVIATADSFKDTLAIVEDTLNLGLAVVTDDPKPNKIVGKVRIEHGVPDEFDFVLNDKFHMRRYAKINFAHELMALCF